MSYKVKEINEKVVWERLVLSFNPKSFLQSWNWGETNKILGKKIFRLGIYNNQRLLGVCMLIKETAKRGPHFLIPAGPMLVWQKKNLVEFFFNYLKVLAKREGVWFIRVRPELLDAEGNKMLFRELGFIPAPMHLHAENTWVLNIGKSDEEILSGMRKSTRYLVRKSWKSGLSLEVTADISKTQVLKNLQDETVERLKFVGFPKKLFDAQIATFGIDNQAKLFICRSGKVPLVASIVIFYGNYVFYHQSGSSNKNREMPASYFVQWHIIQEGKRRGCKFYDMWGAVPLGRINHRFFGPSLFKEGFGGDRVDWLHAQDLPISPLYKLTYAFETVRRKIRRL